jgi:hypothetical protein
MAKKPVQPRTVGPMNYRAPDASAPPPRLRPVKRVSRVVGPSAPRRVPVAPKPAPPDKNAFYSDSPEGYRVPKEQEHELRKAARQKYPSDQKMQDAYVYGYMRQQGWKPEHHSPWDGKTYHHWYFGKMKV